MVVFKLDGWTLEQAGPNGTYNYLLMKHTCKPHIDGRELAVPKVYVYPEGASHCCRCAIPIPEGIIALYYLHGWDKP